MSTNIVGFKPPDATFRRMKAAWEACEAAGVPVPKEVDAFFDSEPPDEAGVSISLAKAECVRTWESDAQSGYELDLTKLDPTIKVVRFFNGW